MGKGGKREDDFYDDLEAVLLKEGKSYTFHFIYDLFI